MSSLSNRLVSGIRLFLSGENTKTEGSTWARTSFVYMIRVPVWIVVAWVLLGCVAISGVLAGGERCGEPGARRQSREPSLGAQC